MKSNIKVILAVACLALATLACAAVTGGSNTPTPTAPIETDVPGVPTEAQPGTGDVLLIDDFSSAQWGTGTDADSSVEYASEALQMIVFTKNHFIWSTPDNEDYQNVHMEVTVINNDTDSTTAFGLMCNQQGGEDNSFYYFAMTPAGEYAIAKAAAGQTDVFLTNNDEWASSDLISKNASSYRVGADCGNGNLTLYVDGQQIASISDSTYTSGGVAIFTWSGEEVASANVSFDDFAMTELP
ncbi:MAG TPA: hypothetical protein VGA72_16360 [Anaerolineales bacterium]